MNHSARAALAAASLALALAACGKREQGGEAQAPAGAGDEEKVLHVYNWSDYIADDTIANFEKRTGIEVTYDVFDSNDMLETRLLQGNSGYDVVVPSASFLERQIKAGVFQKLDPGQLPNLKNLDPEIMQQVARHDPGNEHSVPYLWGTTGIGYNADKVRQALGADTPLDSWSFIYDPANAQKLQSCGISMLDAPDEVLKTVLAWIGRDPNSQQEADLRAAEEKLMAIRPFIRKIHSSQYIDDLATGEVCVAVGWSGDVLQARDRAAEAGQSAKIEYAIPKEGTIIWFDMLAIPADARHSKNAHAFINYLMEPEVAANNTNYRKYANPNSASLAYVQDEVKSNPGIYPPPELKQKLFPSLAYGEEFQRLMNRMWTKFKTGE